MNIDKEVGRGMQYYPRYLQFYYQKTELGHFRNKRKCRFLEPSKACY